MSLTGGNFNANLKFIKSHKLTVLNRIEMLQLLVGVIVRHVLKLKLKIKII
jgi:hypothetical protein